MSKRALPSSFMLKLIDKVSSPAGRVERAMKGLRSGTNKALDAVNNLSKVGRKFSTLQNKIGDNISATTERVGNKFNALRKQIGDNMSATAERAGNKFNALQNKIGDNISATADRAGNKFNALRNKISNSVSGAANRVTHAMKRIRTGSGKAFNALNKLPKLRGKFTSLQKKLSGFSKSFCNSQEKAAGCGGKLLAWGKKIGSMSFKGGKAMLDKTAEFEGYESRLKILEGSGAKAKASMAWIEDFAGKTPHKLGEVTEAFVKMRANGLDPTSGLMKSIGNASTVMNKPLSNAVDAMTGALNGDNKGLSDFGISATTDDKKKTIRYEYSDKQGKQQILIAKKGNQKDIQKKLTKILDDKFGGAMADNAKTWSGMVDNLTDKWDKFQRMIMQSGPFEKLKGYLGGILDKINVMEKDGSLKTLADNIGQSIGKAIDYVAKIGVVIYDTGNKVGEFLKPLMSFIGGWDTLAIVLTALPFIHIIGIIGSLGSSISSLFGVASGLGSGLLWIGTTALPALGKAFLWAGGTLLKFSLALLTSPITWIVAVIAALAAGAYLLYKNWEPISNYFSNMWTEIKAYFADSLASILDSIKGVIEVFPDWALPEGLEADNIDATIQKYRELGNVTDKLKPVDFKLPSMNEVMDDMGISGIMEKFDTMKSSTKANITKGTTAAALSGMLAVSPTAMAGSTSIQPFSPKPITTMQQPNNTSSTPVVMHVSINITPSPGMDEHAIGNEVARQMEKLQRQASARSRSRLFDEE